MFNISAHESSMLISSKETASKNRTNYVNYLIALLVCSVLSIIALKEKIFNHNPELQNMNLIIYPGSPLYKPEPIKASDDVDDDDDGGGPVEDFGPAGFKMMSLIGSSAKSNFKSCQNNFVRGDFLNLKVNPGCISLYTDDISQVNHSKVTTFCGCDIIGPKRYDLVALQQAGLISDKDEGLISYIATGEGASVSVYNRAEFESETKKVFGPGVQSALSAFQRGEEDGTWDNEVYSVILQAWVSCDQPPIRCNPVDTQAPVGAPTFSPFVDPTPEPTPLPSALPTDAPLSPTYHPIVEPTKEPVSHPTMHPLPDPTVSPISFPTFVPISEPSHKPTRVPTYEPTKFPTPAPINLSPTLEPTMAPTFDAKIIICKGQDPSDPNPAPKVVPGKVYPRDGCAILYWNAVDKFNNSVVSTICSCMDIGALAIPAQMLNQVGSVDVGGDPEISAIITGDKTSVTIYTASDLTGDDKFVIGPNTVTDLTKITINPNSNILWDKQVHSMQQMSWSECVKHKRHAKCYDKQ